jgi:hypothetical protein
MRAKSDGLTMKNITIKLSSLDLYAVAMENIVTAAESGMMSEKWQFNDEKHHYRAE